MIRLRDDYINMYIHKDKQNTSPLRDTTHNVYERRSVWINCNTDLSTCTICTWSDFGSYNLQNYVTPNCHLVQKSFRLRWERLWYFLNLWFHRSNYLTWFRSPITYLSCFYLLDAKREIKKRERERESLEKEENKLRKGRWYTSPLGDKFS